MRSLTPVSRSLVLPVLRFDAQSSHLSAKSTQLYRLVEQHYPAFVTYLAEQGKSLPALLRRYDAQGCTSVAGGRMPGATIHMNSVHTGWITDEDPAHLAQHKIDVHLFAPPLDVVDGAARIVDPIFAGLATGRHAWGQFFKDYKPTCW